MPASIVMARNLTPVWLAWPLRRVMEIARCIPEVAWGLILIAIIGIGPMAGAVALGLHSAGCLARLFAEALENAPRAPQDAMGSEERRVGKEGVSTVGIRG